MTTQTEVARTAAKGLVAGAAATVLAIDPIANFLYEHESPDARRREHEANHGRNTYNVAAEQIARVFHLRLSDRGMRRLGLAVHWGITLGAGVTYAILRRRSRRWAAGHGLAFAMVLELAGDELGTWAAGWAAPPWKYPWQNHVRGVVAHAGWGLVAESTLRALDRVL